ncbi:MAG TPA: hypothetical protein VGM82_02130 [Gemmatimonadaceae bacterium]|jgi:hypothetical protein
MLRFKHLSTISAFITVTAVAMSAMSTAAAQSASGEASRWEFLVSSGKLIPTGAQRATLDAGNHTAAQLAYAFMPSFALTSSLGWARTHDLATTDAPHLNVFMFDVGSELRVPRQADSGGMKVNPFAGAGAGMRSYSARSVAGSARRNVAAYLSAGSEIGTERYRLRLEARDYVSGFRAFNGQSATVARNDVVVMVGLRIVKQ